MKSVISRSETWACLFYALLVSAVALRHEPWADEAQAWLMARDSDLMNLWMHLLRLEGSPGLWHSLLFGLIRLGLPYSGLNLVSAALGAAAAVVLAFGSPFPLIVRVLLPFTYFFSYQYAVVARSYDLAPLVLFLIAALYPNAFRRIWLTVTLLVALAMISVHGFLISGAIAFTLALQNLKQRSRWEPQERRRAGLALVCYLLSVLFIAYAVWPDGNAVFVAAPNWSLSNFFGMSRYALHQAFGPDYLPGVLIALSIPVLWGTPGLAFFALSTLALCLFGAAVYSNVWHSGFFVLSWLFALWISFRSARLRWPGVVALALFIVVQIPWTWDAVRYDWTQPYSGSKAAAEYLKQEHLLGSRIVAIGFSTVAVQPYLPRNVFQNYSAEGGHDSFWLWSNQNTTNDAGEMLGSDGPEFVLLGYSGDSDRKLWSHLIVGSGYHRVRRFGGNVFWRTGPFQPETYELFRRGPVVSNARLTGELQFGNGNSDASDQLLWGFAAQEKDEEQWVGTNFSVALQRPSASTLGVPGRITVDFDVPDSATTAGCYSFRAYVSGAPMAPERLCTGGSYHYVRQVSPRNLFWAVVPVAFTFSKTGFVLNEPPQERFAVVRKIELAN